MAGLNKVQLIGYLGRDPELRYTQSQNAVATISVATTRKYKDRNDKIIEETEWSRVVVWGKQAESCEKFLKKGSLIYVEGRLQTKSWEDEHAVKRWTTDVVAERVQFLDRNPGDRRPHPAEMENGPGDTPPETYVPSDPGDDEIPF